MCNTNGMCLDSATELGKMFDQINDKNVPEYVRADTFFFCVKVKQAMLDHEEYELLADFKRIEELHEQNIPVVYDGQRIGA
jgi:hypothetical protein